MKTIGRYPLQYIFFLHFLIFFNIAFFLKTFNCIETVSTLFQLKDEQVVFRNKINK